MSIKEKIQTFDDFQLECFVRNRLGQVFLLDTNLNFLHQQSHLRFNMSGSDSGGVSCFTSNNKILQLFDDTGLYENYTALYVKSYKGTINVIDEQSHDKLNDVDYGGWGTVEIIVDVLKRLLINSNSGANRMIKIMEELTKKKKELENE